MKKILKYIYFKIKFRGLLKSDFSVSIGRKSTFEGMNKIHSNSHFEGRMGLGSYIGSHSLLNAKIGRYTSIAPYVRSNIGLHPYNTFVSTSPIFYSTSKHQNGETFTSKQRFNEFRYADDENKYGIIIGNDCWVGEGVFFVGGITIGDGAVILAHTVVTKDVPAYAIVGGVPGEVIKYRFDESTITYLQNFKWWNKEVSWLKENIDFMMDVEKFKKKNDDI